MILHRGRLAQHGCVRCLTFLNAQSGLCRDEFNKSVALEELVAVERFVLENVGLRLLELRKVLIQVVCHPFLKSIDVRGNFLNEARHVLHRASDFLEFHVLKAESSHVMRLCEFRRHH